ncbi:Hsp70 family protein [Gordonia sp. NPDC058843]|uniref:Hsp70 family protein n=1 Tax=Gordonia sp. NPDC058843 TaxID=3346648 RepID=UPI00367B24A2
MAIGIGVKIGSVNSVAVAASEQSWEGTVSVETAALAGAGDFVARVGDPVPMLDDHGRTRAAADIHAAAVTELVGRLELPPGADVRLTVVHPDTWSVQAVDEARSALADRREAASAESVDWVPESRALLAAAEHSEGAFAGGIVVAYDLGASGVTVTVLATGDESREIGRPLHLDTVSGNEFDRLLLGQTLSVTGTDATVEAALADPGRSAAVVDDLNRLRNECRHAKESLSVDTDTVVDVRVGEVATEARLVRDDIEDLLRGPLMESVALVREALAAADVDANGFGPSGVSAILLGGGGAAIPLVTELLSSTVRVPVVHDPEPATASAAGGALLASAALAAAVSATPLPAAAETARLVASTPDDRPLREIVPAPRTPVTEPAPRLSRRKRGTLITLGAAALALVTATGLSVGTGLVGSVGESTPPPAGAATTTATSSQNPGNAPGTTSTGARPGTAADPATVTRAPGTATGTDTPRRTTAGAPATGSTSGRPAPAPAPAPAPGAPSAPYNPGTPSVPDQNPPAEPEVPDPGTGGGSGGGTGGGTPGRVLELPGRVLDGTGQVLCGVTGVVC